MIRDKKTRLLDPCLLHGFYISGPLHLLNGFSFLSLFWFVCFCARETHSLCVCLCALQVYTSLPTPPPSLRSSVNLTSFIYTLTVNPEWTRTMADSMLRRYVIPAPPSPMPTRRPITMTPPPPSPPPSPPPHSPEPVQTLSWFFFCLSFSLFFR